MKVLTSLNKCQWKRKENLGCCCSFIGLKLLYYFPALDDEYQCGTKTRSERFVFVQTGPVSCVWFYFCLNLLCNWVGHHFWTVPATLGGIWSFSSHLCSQEASDPAALFVFTNIWSNGSRTGLAGTDLAQSIFSERAQIVFVSLRSPQLHTYDRPSCALQLCSRSNNFLSWKAVTCGGSLSNSPDAVIMPSRHLAKI